MTDSARRAFGADVDAHGTSVGETRPIPFATRPVLQGTLGMVAAGHYLAAAIGLSLLEKGGNAVDAGVAAGFAVALLKPQSVGIGGEAPILIHRADQHRTVAINGQGWAPRAATIDWFRSRGISLIPSDGFLPATVPAQFASWCTALQHFGTASLADVLGPAVDLAEGGFPMYAALHNAIVKVAERYRTDWPTSAALYLQTVYSKEPNRYLEFWKDERELLTELNKEGYRAIDAGPLTLGYRLSNTRTGYDITRRLIYPKGAYVLHMVRMMMWDRKNGDQLFRDTMQDFVKTYSNKPATTEDFKAMIEKHMTPEMDLQGNHRMDWFFNEYVYGTALPGYKLDYSFDKDPSGDVLFSLKVTQSGVDDNFRMLVPVYLELADGRTVNFGRARLSGNTSVEQKVAIRGLKTAPKRALLNYNYDVLASN